MSVAMKDGAWVSATIVIKFDCTKCGNFYTSSCPLNDREQDAIIREHSDIHKGKA